MIFALESVRGLTALFISFYHFPSESILYYKLGYNAVYLFFSLSGFVIALNYFNKINNFKSLILFQKKRLFRIYPVHFFVLILVLLIQCTKFILIKMGFPAGTEAFTPDYWYTLRDFILNIFLLQAVWEGGYFLSWNGAAWSISTELYTYLVFGILVLISFRKSYIYITLSVIYLIFHQEIILFVNSIKYFPNLTHFFFDCILYFLSGSLMFFVYKKIKFRINDFIFLIILIPLYLNLFINLQNHIFYSFLILLIALLKKNSIIFIILNNKSLVYLGTISYSFYMIHQVILYCYIQVLKIFNLGFSFSNELAAGTGSVFFDTMITISYTILSIIVAVFMHKFIESKYRIK